MSDVDSYKIIINETFKYVFIFVGLLKKLSQILTMSFWLMINRLRHKIFDVGQI